MADTLCRDSCSPVHTEERFIFDDNLWSATKLKCFN